MFCNILELSFNILKSNFYVADPMSDVAWKCFRCNLSFKDEDVASLHKQISNHSVSKVKAITA